MTQIERIMEMEEILYKSQRSIQYLSEAMNNYLQIRADLVKLTRYYESKDWLSDFNDDQANLLPKDLKRGVLSEDAIYHLLEEHDELLKQFDAVLKELRP